MITTAEALLALRAPGADWLATLITALDESRRDPEFTSQLNAVFAQLATQSIDDGLPAAIVEAAHRRTQDFTRRLTEDLAAVEPPPIAAAERPRLTLVAG